MARKKPPPPAAPSDPPQIYEATLGPNGAVHKGSPLTRPAAEARRKASLDVVVCGENLSANRSLARAIELAANGTVKVCPPHPSAGTHALPIVSRTRGRRKDIPSMKPRSAKPFEPLMRFFTPDLYARINSTDDAVADAADADWENASTAYRGHLVAIRDRMPSQVRKLADLCLHDAEVLAFEEVAEPAYPVEPIGPLPVWSAMSILSVRQGGNVVSLIYLLWDRVRTAGAPDDWPFSKARPHWLYDEIDTAPGRPEAFVHRVLLSDGRVLEIPFASVVAHGVPLGAASGNGKAKQRA